jgi:hypothetical protein
MRNVSEHTLQLNLWVSLCQVDPQFPGDLRRAGYVVDIIDPDFVHEGEPVNPDIILTSSTTNHSVVVDCKSWILKAHQNERYENLVEAPGVLTSQGIVTGVSPEGFDIDFGYSSFEDLTENDDLPDNDFAVVQFEDGEVLIVDTVGGRDFDEEALSECFPIQLDENDRIPTDYYPFDPGIPEDEEQMIISVLQETIHLAIGQQSFTADDILNGAHPFWVDWDDEKQQEARARVDTIISQYTQRGLSEHIEKVQRSDPPEWRVVSKSLQALQRKASEFIEEAEAALEQRRLEEFGEGDENDGDN